MCDAAQSTHFEQLQRQFLPQFSNVEAAAADDAADLRLVHEHAQIDATATARPTSASIIDMRASHAHRARTHPRASRVRVAVIRLKRQEKVKVRLNDDSIEPIDILTIVK